MLVHRALALGAGADRFLPAEVGFLLVLVTVAEVELHLVFAGQFQLRREGAAHLAAETVERPDAAVGHQLVRLAQLELPPAHRLPKAELAPVAFAVEPLVRFLHHAAALGAGRLELAVVARHGIAVERLGGTDDFFGHRANLVHERLSVEFPPLDLLELEFPLAGQLRLGEGVHLERREQRDQRGRLCGGHQFLLLSHHVFVADQLLDDRGPGRRRAEPLVAHCLAQFLVVNALAGVLHRAEQRGFRMACRRPGGLGLDDDLVRLHRLARLDRYEVSVVLLGLVASVHGEPARLHEHLAFGLERLALHAGDAGGDQEFRRRIKHGDEPLGHEVVNLLLLLLECGGRRLERGDDGEVIGDLGVVEHLLVAAVHPVVFQHVTGEAAVARLAKRLERLLHCAGVVLRQAARVGSRIGQHLVPLVQRLRDAQRVARRETKPRVGLALQRREVEQRLRGLLGRLALLAHLARLAVALGLDAVRLGLFPDALRPFVGVVGIFFETLVEPPAGVLAGGGPERGVHFPVIFRLEHANLLLALNYHGQRRRLHPADRRQIKSAALRVERRHRPRAVDAHKPVGLAPAVGGAGQRLHVVVAAQVGKAFVDRVRRHRPQPKPRDRFARRFPRVLLRRVLDDVAKNQFPLAPGVTGIHEVVDVVALDQPQQHPEP